MFSLVLLILCTLSCVPASNINEDYNILISEVNVNQIPVHSTEGVFLVFGPSVATIIGDGENSLVVSARSGKGKICAFGHDVWLEANEILSPLGPSSIARTRVLRNCFNWVKRSNVNRPKVLSLLSLSSLNQVVLSDWGGSPNVVTSHVELLDELDTNIPDIIVVHERDLHLKNNRDREDVMINAINKYIKNGGGLIISAIGWAFPQHPANIILSDAGILISSTPSKKDALYDQNMFQENYHALAALKTFETKPINKKGEIIFQVSKIMEMAVNTMYVVPSFFLIEFEKAKSYCLDFDGNLDIRLLPISSERMLFRGCIRYVHVYLSIYGLSAIKSFKDFALKNAAMFPGAVGFNALETQEFFISTTRYGWQPLGAYAKPGIPVTISLAKQNLKKIKSMRVKIGCTVPNLWDDDDDWHRWPDVVLEHDVVSSATTIVSFQGGLLQIYLHEDEVTLNNTNISVLVKGAARAMHYCHDNHLPSQFTIMQNFDVPWGFLESKHVVLCLPKEATDSVENIVDLMNWWERVMDEAYSLKGVRFNEQEKQHFSFDMQLSKGSMYAGHPIRASLQDAMKAVDISLDTDHWGFFHEVGHNMQSHLWTFDSVIEVTCNLWSLYLEEKMGKTSQGRRNLAVHEEKALSELSFQDFKDDHFLALMMYLELRKEFGWKSFTDTFTAYRNFPAEIKPRTNREKIDQWMIQYGRVVKKDLRFFFSRWDINISTSSKIEVENDGYPIWMPPLRGYIRLIGTLNIESIPNDEFFLPTSDMDTYLGDDTFISRSTTRLLSLYNSGNGLLRLARVEIEGAGFSVTLPDVGFGLPSKSFAPSNLLVTFRPLNTLEHVAIIRIYSNTNLFSFVVTGSGKHCVADHDCDINEIPRGVYVMSGKEHKLPISSNRFHEPSRHDGSIFQSTTIGIRGKALKERVLEPLHFELHNQNAEEIKIQDIIVSSSSFAVSCHQSLPVNVQPGDKFRFTIMFSPTSSKMHQGEVALSGANGFTFYFKVKGWGFPCKNNIDNCHILRKLGLCTNTYVYFKCSFTCKYCKPFSNGFNNYIGQQFVKVGCDMRKKE